MTGIAVPALKRASPPLRWWRGDPVDPAWVRPALLGLLAATTAAFLWGLSASGYANQFYSAAAQAGSVSWKAFFFGSSDAGNSITVDKPPAALWPMALSVRLFGLSAWSILVPQALMGVASVGALYATVRRGFGPAAGLLSGAVLALTPVAALMFRFNNPDALLCLLSVLAIYCVVRALDAGATRWLLAAGALLGFAFLVKTLQAWLIVPVLAVVYLAWAPVRPPKRLWQLLAAGGAMIAACGWWIATVELWPASSRPYIGGSQSNSFLELTFGYNGFGRITGNETGSVGGGRGWGDSGIARLFGSSNGGQIAWLLPTALVLLFATLYLLHRSRSRRAGGNGKVSRRSGWRLGRQQTVQPSAGGTHWRRRRPRPSSAQPLASEEPSSEQHELESSGAQPSAGDGQARQEKPGASGLSLSVGDSQEQHELESSGAQPSAGDGQEQHGSEPSETQSSVDNGQEWHEPESLTAQPSAGGSQARRRRLESWSARRHHARLAQVWLWGGSLIVTAAVFSFMAGIFHEYYTIALAPYIAAVVGIGATMLWRRRRFPAVAVTLAVVTVGTAAWAFVLLGRSDWMPWLRWTVLAAGVLAVVGLVLLRRLPKRLAVVVVGLALLAGLAGPMAYTAYTVVTSHSGSIVTAGPAVDGGRGGPGGPMSASYGQGGPGGDGQGNGPVGGNGQARPGGKNGDGGPGGNDGSRQGGRSGGMGGLLNGQSVDGELAELVGADAEDYTWAAATTGSQNASSFQLATGEAVMAIGGFNGSDPSPTLDTFKEYVANGEIHFYIAADMGQGPGGGDGTSAQIADWVADNYSSTTVDGVTVYDLSD